MAGGGSGVSVRAIGQGDRETWPKRWVSARTSGQDRSGRFDQSAVVERRVVAKANSSSISLMHLGTEETYAGRLSRRPNGTASEVGPALRVVVMYEDPLTRH